MSFNNVLLLVEEEKIPDNLLIMTLIILQELAKFLPKKVKAGKPPVVKQNKTNKHQT